MPGVHSPIETIRTVTGDDGYVLRYCVWQEDEQATCTLFLLNGMMSHSGWFGDIAQQLARWQVKVVGADRRGSGLNEADRGDAPSRHLLLSDLRHVIEEERCSGPTYVVGWCWGAILAINAAIDFETLVDGIILLAPGLFPSGPLTRRVQSALAQSADDDSLLLQSPITPEMFTDIDEVRSFIARDLLASRLFTRRFFRVSERMRFVAATRLRQLKQRALVLLATNDATVDNRRTVQAFENLPGTVTLSELSCNHGMQFEVPGEIAAHIRAWI